MPTFKHVVKAHFKNRSIQIPKFAATVATVHRTSWLQLLKTDKSHVFPPCKCLTSLDFGPILNLLVSFDQVGMQRINSVRRERERWRAGAVAALAAELGGEPRPHSTGLSDASALQRHDTSVTGARWWLTCRQPRQQDLNSAKPHTHTPSAPTSREEKIRLMCMQCHKLWFDFLSPPVTPHTHTTNTHSHMTLPIEDHEVSQS